MKQQEKCFCCFPWPRKNLILFQVNYVRINFFQFLTLNNADEKIRLVPVLNTILKLSRPETEMLNCVAKGQKGMFHQLLLTHWNNLYIISNYLTQLQRHHSAVVVGATFYLGAVEVVVAIITATSIYSGPSE